MDPTKNKSHNAKVLLFGEHSLMCGSMALSIPFDRFHGKLVLPEKSEQSERSKISGYQIQRFVAHLNNLKAERDLAFSLNTDRLSEDVAAGLWFDSDIPQGYGLGSSGALVASVFASYSQQEFVSNMHTMEDLLRLKSFFALLESYFHGTSSGLDPLISFLNKAILLSGRNEPEILDSKWNPKNGKGAVFLIDSGVTGETQPLVDYFKKSYQEPIFGNRVDNELIPLVNQAINSYVSCDADSLLQTLKKLSLLQMQLLKKMIPESVTEIWQAGLESDDYSLKLCGSGGGGMILGFTHNRKKILKNLSEFNPLIIHSL